MEHNQLMVGKVHGHTMIIKMIDGKPHIQDKEKSKYKWTETIIESKRLKRFRPINDAELVGMING